MRTCILCGKQTLGSVGAAGIKWPMICQACKDIEDRALKVTIESGCAGVKQTVQAIDEDCAEGDIQVRFMTGEFTPADIIGDTK